MGKIQEAGDELFLRFQDIMPPPSGAAGKRAPSPAAPRVAAGLERFYAEAKMLRERRKLGIVARARVARHLQGRLLAAGYAPELVSRVVFSLLLSAFVGRGT